MKVIPNIFKPVGMLKIFFEELLDGYNVEMLIKTSFMNRFFKIVFAKKNSGINES